MTILMLNKFNANRYFLLEMRKKQSCWQHESKGTRDEKFKFIVFFVLELNAPN